jgi:hypothetical protein
VQLYPARSAQRSGPQVSEQQRLVRRSEQPSRARQTSAWRHHLFENENDSQR